MTQPIPPYDLGTQAAIDAAGIGPAPVGRYRDSLGRLVQRRDRVAVLGFADMQFEVVDLRPEGAAVIRNTADGYTGTSTVPLSYITRVESGESR